MIAKSLPLAVLLALSSLAAAGSRVGVSFGGRRSLGGRVACGGLQLSYRRHTAHSTFSLRFTSGAWGGYCGSRVFLPGPASSVCWSGWAPGGVYLYRGWVPRSPYFAAWYPPHVGLGPFERVDAVVFTGPPTGAVFGYRGKAPEREPTSGRAATRPEALLEKLSASKLVDLGDERFARGDFAGAVECYNVAVEKAPQDPTAAFALGHGLFAVGYYDEAARELRRAVRLFPDIVSVPMRRRDFYGDPKVFDQQLARLANHLGRRPQDAAARFLLAYNCYFSDRLAEARKHFAALGRGDPEAAVFLRSPRLRGR